METEQGERFWALQHIRACGHAYHRWADTTWLNRPVYMSSAHPPLSHVSKIWVDIYTQHWQGERRHYIKHAVIKLLWLACTSGEAKTPPSDPEWEVFNAMEVGTGKGLNYKKGGRGQHSVCPHSLSMVAGVGLCVQCCTCSCKRRGSDGWTSGLNKAIKHFSSVNSLSTRCVPV